MGIFLFQLIYFDEMGVSVSLLLWTLDWMGYMIWVVPNPYDDDEMLKPGEVTQNGHTLRQDV